MPLTSFQHCDHRRGNSCFEEVSGIQFIYHIFVRISGYLLRKPHSISQGNWIDDQRLFPLYLAQGYASCHEVSCLLYIEAKRQNGSDQPGELTHFIFGKAYARGRDQPSRSTSRPEC